MLFLSVIGVFCNLCVLVALISFSSIQIKNQTTTLFIKNLCVSDLIFCALNIPLTAIPFYTRSWPFGEIICRLYPVSFFGNIGVSLLTITLISVNR
ncbi:protein trapped in endoderm-1-like protein [Leptotrombidium deliense]|uniref:Protein trapped in endoderm-1-like protein n=1 Tax=Leptotrombidium deliense TaxID=299467 RepID=A0A443S1J2_9ACAR|nr:protein trapped in endoderm-1-like protein [Leptotrombidium deliense]